MLLRRTIQPVYTARRSIVMRVTPKVLIQTHDSITRFSENDIIPEFLDTYARLCANVPVDTCKSIMVIPTADEQARILQLLNTLSHITDIERVKGLLLYLLTIDDKQTFETVMNAILQFNNAIDVVQEVYSNIIS